MARKDTSNALVEVRTVLSRAHTARDIIVDQSYAGNTVRDEAAYESLKSIYPHWNGPMPDWWASPASGAEPDPEGEEMVARLDQVIDLLAEYERKPHRRRV